MKAIGKGLIRFYKRFISAKLPSYCRFTPSCSSYAYQAIDKYGLIIGSVMGMFRILRCNPFSRGGYDPVKENFKGCAKWLL
ncbi:MAG: membrane protein insertion efficiency factor YidD [Christensenellales bacterium]|jgi:putative membrane protein insertion efficiency factor